MMFYCSNQQTNDSIMHHVSDDAVTYYLTNYVDAMYNVIAINDMNLTQISMYTTV